jgi:hypothetical protein
METLTEILKAILLIDATVFITILVAGIGYVVFDLCRSR